MTIRTLLAPLTVALVSLAVTGCKKEEPPPPLPSAAPPTATAPFKLEAIDAGIAEIDSGGPKKPTGTGGGSRGLGPCCAALLQNANSAPEPTKTYMMQAAAVCQSAAAAGQGVASAGGLIAAALKGAGMPAVCK